MENGFDKNTLYACMEFSKNNIGERDGGEEQVKREQREEGRPAVHITTLDALDGLEESILQKNMAVGKPELNP